MTVFPSDIFYLRERFAIGLLRSSLSVIVSIGQNFLVRGNATKNTGRVNRARMGVENTEESIIVVSMIGEHTTLS